MKHHQESPCRKTGDSQMREPTRAELFVSMLLPRADATQNSAGLWPSKSFAKQLPRLLSDSDYTDEELCDAVSLLRDRFGFDQAIRQHGFQTLWAADLGSPDHCGTFGAFAFRLGRIAFLDHMFDEGYLSLDEKLANGKGIGYDALYEDAAYLLYLAQKRAILAQLARETGGAKLYTILTETYLWSECLEELHNRAFNEGIHPWDKPVDDDLPILRCLYEEEQSLWILDHAREGDLSPDLLGTLLRRCPKNSPLLRQRLTEIELACRERIQLGAAVDCASQSPAAAHAGRFSELAPPNAEQPGNPGEPPLAEPQGGTRQGRPSL